MAQQESFESLAKKLAEISKQITVGATYLHYKKQHPYKVLFLVIAEENQQPYVVYQAQYGMGVSFVRSASSWLEEVEWQGKKVIRFTKLAKR